MRNYHGMSEAQEYKIWSDIKTRCRNEKHRSYKNYGGRGILICEEWFNSFESFYSDIGKRPSKDHSVERIDNNGNYEKSNCKWATRIEQGENKRNNRNITIDGVTKTMSAWARSEGITISLIFSRIRVGKEGRDLISRARCGAVTYNGMTDTYDGWSKKTGIKASTIAMRILKYGWTIEKSLTKGVTNCKY